MFLFERCDTDKEKIMIIALFLKIYKFIDKAVEKNIHIKQSTIQNENKKVMENKGNLKRT